jgi:hypothetical protein
LRKNSNKELKKLKQEKESLIIQLSKSHTLINSLKSENTMLFNTIDTLENKLKESEDLLKKFSCDNFKSMLCIHSNNSNMHDIIVDDLGASTLHASDSEINSLFIKLVIVDTTCFDKCDNFCLKNCAEPESKDHQEKQSQGKFVPTCHHCGIIGHIRPNCYLLKSQKPWNKQDAPKKDSGERSSSDKYVPPRRRHISQRGKDFVICENSNLKFAEPIKKHSNKQRQPICHHCGTSGHFRPHCLHIQNQKPRIKKQEPKRGKSSSKPFMPHLALVRLDKLDMAHNPASQVNKVWIRNDETVHPLRGSGLI